MTAKKDLESMRKLLLATAMVTMIPGPGVG